MSELSATEWGSTANAVYHTTGIRSAICRSHSISCCRETTAAKSGFSVTRAQTAYATLRGRKAVKAALS